MKKTHAVTIKLICFTINEGILAAFLPHRTIPSLPLSAGHDLEDDVGKLIGKTLGLK